MAGWPTIGAGRGVAGLADRSHRPNSCPHQTAAAVETLVAEMRRKHPRWGSKRIRLELLKRPPDGVVVPSRATINRILTRQCLAFAQALQRFGVPEEVLTDNGKQFTDRFGKGGEVLFRKICRKNGITHRLTHPALPTTTGKVERSI
jgi:transposase InsO family protein